MMKMFCYPHKTTIRQKVYIKTKTCSKWETCVYKNCGLKQQLLLVQFQNPVISTILLDADSRRCNLKSAS